MSLSFFNRVTLLTDLQKLQYYIGESKICMPMNKLDKENVGEDGKVRLWLNPHNQKCFNFGWFTYQDYYDWLKGTGVIVKGNTQEEKDKFFEAARFEATYNYGWSIGYYKKYYHYIDETYYPMCKPLSGYINNVVDKPLKITKTSHAEIIGKIFGYICNYFSDYDIENNQNQRRKIEDELHGAKQALYSLGVGYSGACNTPEEALNLNFAADICKYKCIYLYMLKNNVKLPDYDFIYNYKE